MDALDNLPQSDDHIVAALYKFVTLDQLEDWQAALKDICQKAGLCGTLLIAHEGLNGTISGRYAGVRALLEWLDDTPEFDDIEVKYAIHQTAPFHRMKVRLKKEIVSMGRPEVEPAKMTGTYVKPEDWNALISAPDVLLVDTRNDYEVAIGQFKNAVNPFTVSFRDFPAWAENLKQELAEKPDSERPKKVAMYCTGGIRCEKSTALMKQIGFEDVYHLKGGILKYFEEVEEADSLFEGECFVFDNRVAVNHQLEKGQYEMCHACRMPLSEADLKSNAYHKGISCPHCINATSPEQRARFSERQKQVQLAQKRGEDHIGAKRSHHQNQMQEGKKDS